jgi:hypothetical protein
VRPARIHLPLLLGFVKFQPCLFIEIRQQHVFHDDLPPTVNRSADAWIDTAENFSL